MFDKFKYTYSINDSYFSKIKREISVFDDDLELLSLELNTSKEETLKKLDELVKMLLENSLFGIRISYANLEMVLRGDRILKNQFETGKSDGIYDPNERRIKEKEVLHVSEFLNVEDRPIYGMCFPRENLCEYIEKGPGYWLDNEDGCVLILDKDRIKDVTTFTLGDSLKNEKTLRSSLLSNPIFNGSFSKFYEYLLECIRDNDFRLENLFREDNEYLEFQIHGRDNHNIMNIVSSVVFIKDAPESLKTLLDELGISYSDYPRKEGKLI